MSGNANVVWICLVGGMLVQLTYLILPLQRWDWARYLGSAAMPLFVFLDVSNKQGALTPKDGVFLCGMFTFVFATLFRKRLLPRLSESTILTWTVVLLCVYVGLGDWQSAKTSLIVGACLVVLGLVMFQTALPYFARLALYAWFLLAVVAIGVLQFRGSDYSLLIAGGAANLDYRFALIDGLAGAYIGVHAALLYEMLPIPHKGEPWADFKTRWRSYLDDVVERVEDQQLRPYVALCLALSIVVLAFLNHHFQFMPGLTLAGLVLVAMPFALRFVPVWPMREEDPVPLLPIAPLARPTGTAAMLRKGIGRARHSGKHRH